jgi:hypothetical protein
MYRNDKDMTNRERFENLAHRFDLAMMKPGVEANPEVAAVLDLLCQGVIVLAKLVIELEENNGS